MNETFIALGKIHYRWKTCGWILHKNLQEGYSDGFDPARDLKWDRRGKPDHDAGKRQDVQITLKTNDHLL